MKQCAVCQHCFFNDSWVIVREYGIRKKGSTESPGRPSRNKDGVGSPRILHRLIHKQAEFVVSVMTEDMPFSVSVGIGKLLCADVKICRAVGNGKNRPVTEGAAPISAADPRGFRTGIPCMMDIHVISHRRGFLIDRHPAAVEIDDDLVLTADPDQPMPGIADGIHCPIGEDGIPFVFLHMVIGNRIVLRKKDLLLHTRLFHIEGENKQRDQNQHRRDEGTQIISFFSLFCGIHLFRCTL